jgi:glycosyltransferase involved in cell wall biosynthesis
MIGVYVHYLCWQHYALKLAKRLNKKYDFSLVHHTCYGSPQLGSGMWKLGIPFMMGPIGGGQFPPTKFKKYFGKGWKEEVLRMWISKLLLLFNPNASNALKNSKLVITENFETEALAKKCGAKNVRMFSDSFFPQVDIFEIKEKQSKNIINILWVGRLLYRKGLPLALEAASLLKGKIKFQLTIIGDGPAGHEVPDLIKKHGLSAEVTWLGQIPWNEVKKYYLSNDILLFTSLRDSSGAQLFEALTFGLPIVTLDHHGSKALLPDNVCVKVPVTDPKETVNAIAEAIQFYYINEDIRLAHSDNAKMFMQNEYTQYIPSLIKQLKEETSVPITSQLL